MHPNGVSDMKLPKSEKDFEELLKGIKWNRIIPPMVSVLQPVIIFGLWLGFAKMDKRADAVSKLIAIAEPIPTIDLNLPQPVVLASLYHSVDEALDVLTDVIEFIKDIDIPSAEDIVKEIKDELLPDPIKGADLISDYNDCVNGYERDTPKLLRNKYTKSIYVNTCLLRKGWGSKAILEIIREKLE